MESRHSPYVNKAKIIPWRLSDIVEGSCFVGLSFYHEDEARSPFRERASLRRLPTGEKDLCYAGKPSSGTSARRRKEPHLTSAQAQQILGRVVDVYEKQVGIKPRKVVLHKTSRYTEDERVGFEAALAGQTPQYSLLTVARRGIFACDRDTKLCCEERALTLVTKKDWSIPRVTRLSCGVTPVFESRSHSKFQRTGVR